MDLVSSCKGKLAYFRIKELKDILTRLGLSKQGKKQDLMDRVLGLLSDDEVFSTRGLARKNAIRKEVVVQIIDDAYRKMQISDASELAAEAQSGLDINSVKEEVENFDLSGRRICCPCRNLLPTDSMIQCIDSECQVQQHISCVIVLENPMESNPLRPPVFYCEACRIKRADPFWVTVAHLLQPVKLIKSNFQLDGKNTLQNVEATFQLSKSDHDLIQNFEYDVQAWCMLLNDNVLFRMQWPLYADLQVNGMAVRTVNRPGSQSLGANGRDDGALIKLFIGEGINKICLSGCDSRVFYFGIRLVRQRTVEQVISMIPEDKDGELFEDALARVCRCVGGGMGTAKEDSDSDLEIIADGVTVNLRCPMSGSRMKIAGRFKPCVHMGCFDLESFVKLNQRSRKWQCPICLKNYSLEDIIIDPYFNRITTMMSHCEEGLTEIEVKPDGSWRVKTKGEIGDLGKWHSPFGSLFAASDEVTSCYEVSRLIEKGDGLQVHGSPEIGINKNLSGIIQGRKQQLGFSSNIELEEMFENHGQRTITMSSNAKGNGRDEDDPSINQIYGGHADTSPSNVNEINSVCHNFDASPAVKHGSVMPTGNADIIILSDSDEENDNVVSHETVYDTCQVNSSHSSLAAHPRMASSYLEDSALDVGANSCFDLFDTSVDDVGMPNWPYPSSAQAGPGFQLFNTDSDVSDFIDLEHSSISCSAPVNGCTLASTPTISSGGQVLDSSVCDTSVDMVVGLVDNPMRFVSEDPSLRTFLPAEPVQPDLVHRPPVSNCIPSGDWISLTLGSNSESFGNGARDCAQHAAKNGVDLRKQLGPDQATSVAALNDEARSNKKHNKKFSGGPFSFPRQPRSVRQRVYP